MTDKRQAIADKASTRGVLNLGKSNSLYQLEHVKPCERLAPFIEQFWLASWALPANTQHIQKNLPHPCVNIAFEHGNSRIVGVVSRRFETKLAGTHQVFGVKFHAGGFYPFFGAQVSKFANTEIPLSRIFDEHEQLEQDVLSASTVIDKSQIVEYTLLRMQVPLNTESSLVRRIIVEIERNRHFTEVGQVARHFDLSVRKLQRLFNSHVGLSVKWIIRKYRMHEVLARIEQGEHNWLDLAYQLGYSDQSHFIKDFRDLIGQTPMEYIREG